MIIIVFIYLYVGISAILSSVAPNGNKVTATSVPLELKATGDVGGAAAAL